MGLIKSIKGLFRKKQKSITDGRELDNPNQQWLKSDSYIDVEEDIKNIWEKLKKRDIINQEFPTEDDYNRINDLLNKYLNGEYAFVKTLKDIES